MGECAIPRDTVSTCALIHFSGVLSGVLPQIGGKKHSDDDRAAPRRESSWRQIPGAAGLRSQNVACGVLRFHFCIDFSSWIRSFRCRLCTSLDISALHTVQADRHAAGHDSL